MKRVHPERVDDIESEKERIKLRKEDHQLRAKIQCFLCPYAATKASNITRSDLFFTVITLVAKA